MSKHEGAGALRRMAALLLACTALAPAIRGQDPLKLLPQNYKLILDNAQVAVIRAHYGPHEKIAVHDHTSYATVFVYLSDSGPVRIDHAEVDEAAASVVRPPTVKGAYRVAAGIKERHSIENLGDISSDFLRVELKGVTLQLKEPFRGKAPGSLAGNVDAVEFKEPELEVERVVCGGAELCPVTASRAASLLIAFTPVTLRPVETGAREVLAAGAVHWLRPGQGSEVVPTAGTPAHLLRILLPAAPQ